MKLYTVKLKDGSAYYINAASVERRNAAFEFVDGEGRLVALVLERSVKNVEVDEQRRGRATPVRR